MRPRALAIALAAVTADLGAATAGPVEGRVFVDVDRDGVLSRGDRTLAGVQVVWETTVLARSGADGIYQLAAPDQDGIVWARVPDGFRPGPVWGAVSARGGTVDLALVELDADASTRFVVASDLHIGKEELRDPTAALGADGLARSLAQAAAQEGTPRFIAITGDLAQANQPEHYALLRDAAADLDLALVPVPGNHDWFDGGAAYRAAFGPPMYSFDSAGVHHVVLNDNAPIAEWTAFLLRDAVPIGPETPLVVYMHRPPEPAALAALESAGVDLLFTGHWHTNMALRHGDLLELNTEPFVRGGIDGTPAGFRVVEIDATGEARGTHRHVVERPVLRVVAPAADQCVDPETRELELIVAVELGAGVDRVRATVGGRAVELTPAGAWSFAARVPMPPASSDEIRVEAVRAGGAPVTVTRSLVFCRCDAAPTGVAAAPPLRTAWVTALGGHPAAAPVVSDGRAFVSVADLADGTRGGVVALDLATGATIWRFAPGADVRASVAVAGDLVVVPAADGALHALEAASGRPRWRRDLAVGVPRHGAVMHASPTVAGDVVYAAVQRRVVALDLATGAVKWQVDAAPYDTSLASRAAPVLAGDLLVGTVARGRSGAFALHADTGAVRWRLDPEASAGIQASPLVKGDTIHLVNAAGVVLALDAATGLPRWRTPLFEAAGTWDYAVLATPALDAGRLFVPTQYDDLVALDASSGAVLWRHRAGAGVLHDAHARTTSSSFPSSPVVAGGLLWIVAGDGVLRALDPATGMSRHELDLGVPGHGGVTSAGEHLLVATFDGTVRDLVHATCRPALPRAVGRGAGSSGVSALLLLAAILVAARLVRRRPPVSSV